MPRTIEFPDAKPVYDFDRDCLYFGAVVDGELKECLVTLELLWTRFGLRETSEELMLQAFAEHKDEIREIARSHIENGWIDKEGRIFLTTRFTRLSVTFGEGFRNWPQGRALAEKAHRALLELIGPYAGGEITVQWNGNPGNGVVQPSISLTILDPDVTNSTSTVFPSSTLGNPATASIHLPQFWGAVLRARSQKLLLKSG